MPQDRSKGRKPWDVQGRLQGHMHIDTACKNMNQNGGPHQSGGKAGPEHRGLHTDAYG
jgi:hypothetical protein